ncbi:glycerol kinase GlpK [Lentibacter algarum]|uniref:glycerol kinase GlpK n=1 Tax=Lentibacter algarum TaxID=576131 RepID=UPI001C091887|nr:glycerol kinase GlpK [Lentibacter algarum]MBU2982411.1 glycerol kinase GlpK [Lentibacter algarum]
MSYILAIDQGTTSSRAIIFDADMRPVASAQEEFEQIFPASGWVEHRAEDIWSSVRQTCEVALKNAGLTGGDLAAIGITNQRETTLLWDRATGEALHNAIVWQDRRTAEMCDALKDAGHEAAVRRQTGLLLDPYFSGTKLAWLLDNIEGARSRAEAGELAFGTVDSWLLWKLTGGKVHATDATNAARTMLYDIREGAWSEDMCDMLNIPQALLPEVKDCAADFGICELFGGAVPVLGMAGDQQAATIGQGCFEPGMLKATYGTGCFALLNTGSEPVLSENRLLTTIAYQLNGEVTYALEGSIFIAGAVVQWLRDGLQMIDEASETQALAEGAEEGVVIVPAFTGLGAPYWDANARGAVFGLTRNTGPKEMARAALQSVGFQTRDLLEAMRSDWGSTAEAALRVDGGMTASDWTMQFLADITGAQVDRPVILETTALGAAWLAGQRAGLYEGHEGFARMWQLERSFVPKMDAESREASYARWQKAVVAARAF